MSDFWRRLIGAALLIATMGFSSCMALLNVRAAGTDTPVATSAER